jgi:hypothetical protein
VEIQMRRTLSGLEPVEGGALRHVKLGEEVTCDVRRVRNPKRNAWFWACMGLVHSNLTEALAAKYPTRAKLVDAMKVLTGWCDTFWLPDGREVIRPRSIAFHAMSEPDFAAFCERCMELVSKYLLPGVNPDDLRREIDNSARERNVA